MKLSIVSGCLARIIHHAASSPRAEIAGLLIGTMKNEKLTIEDAAPGDKSGTAVSVNLTAEMQAVVADRLDREGSKQHIVGWYHSHPGLGVFMSSTDIMTHTTYQTLDPYSVALVIDPASYLASGKPEDADFKIFQLTDDRKYKRLPVTMEQTRISDFRKMFRDASRLEKQKTGKIRARIESMTEVINRNSTQKESGTFTPTRETDE